MSGESSPLSMYRSSDFKCILLPGKCDAKFAMPNLYEEAYGLWLDVWSSEFSKVDFDFDSIKGNAFLRQDVISVLMYKESIAGLFLHTLYPLIYRSVHNSNFLSGLPETSFEFFKKKSITTINSLEFLTVHPMWRGRKAGFSMGALLIDLGIKVGAKFGAEASLGVARRDYKVNSVCANHGGVSVCESIKRVNLDCEVFAIVNNDLKPYPNRLVNEFGSDIWKTHEDLTENSQSKTKLKTAS